MKLNDLSGLKDLAKKMKKEELIILHRADH